MPVVTPLPFQKLLGDFTVTESLHSPGVNESRPSPSAGGQVLQGGSPSRGEALFRVSMLAVPVSP